MCVGRCMYCRFQSLKPATDAFAIVVSISFRSLDHQTLVCMCVDEREQRNTQSLHMCCLQCFKQQCSILFMLRLSGGMSALTTDQRQKFKSFCNNTKLPEVKKEKINDISIGDRIPRISIAIIIT